MLFISYDLPVIRQMSDSIIMTLNGQISEVSYTERLFISANNEYSKHLINPMPQMNF